MRMCPLILQDYTENSLYCVLEDIILWMYDKYLLE